jgi:Protein of unknown function (DUF1003)
LLGVIVAVEAVILSSFILRRQNRMMRRGERRDYLNLQVDLLAEKEITKVLQMVRAICGHIGLQDIMADTEILPPHRRGVLSWIVDLALLPLASQLRLYATCSVWNSRSWSIPLGVEYVAAISAK